MGSGADKAGDDMVVGRTNESQKRTVLVAKDGDEDGYAEDYVLWVTVADSKVLRQVPEGVDAVHATGTVALPTGGAVGTLPPGNGVVATGANGVVGYVHAATRDKTQEQQVQAGVLGAGTASSPGVFGRGAVGVTGYAQDTARDTAWETEDPSGVCGRATGVGVRGKGDDGGVRGESENNFGVEGKSTLAPGVRGTSVEGIGVYGEGAPGVFGNGTGTDSGGIFESAKGAQLRLTPRNLAHVGISAPLTPDAVVVDERFHGPRLPKGGRAGELTTVQDPSGTCTLWFCVRDGGADPALWAQVLLGRTFDGRA
ncbi:hypothetical protein [Streptomyces sp. UNOC14_S4]|uniref:hypothetical protein n=1 Tax=Streptomyces sp. UNOC14_S4 TaxID=2872340 RepID=UPI001E655A92|nr:hypothetical protein [Streptomyces sp. UNOC14_S4]MCC3768170.1 hypothetical protein [Streptomyces sp. UNOC14_S4]